MVFRVTQFALQSQAIQYNSLHQSSVFQFQQQLTSGLRFVRPSEEPISFQQVARLGNEFGKLQIELDTIRSAEAILNNSVSQLVEASDLITSMTTIVQQGIQATDPTDAEALALEAEGVLGQLQLIANSRFKGEYIYGGSKTNRPPFELSSPGIAGRSIAVQYLGSQNNSEVLVGDQLLIDNYYNGLQIFGAGERGPTQLSGRTGARTGTGTDTITSRANLDVIRGPIVVSGSSGVSLGDPDSNSTVIGEFQVTVNDTSGTGAFGTISVNGGAPIAYDNSQSNLPVTTPGGQTIFLDVTSVNPGYSGTFDVVASGFLSVDGGATQTAIDFSTNQVVTESATGKFVTIDSSSIVRTGTDYLDFPGTSNAFQVIHNVIENLRNTRDLATVEAADALDQNLSELEDVRQRILVAMGQQSTSLRTLEGIEVRKDQLSLQLQSDASEIQATDFSQAALELANAQALLEYSFAVTAQINSLNILDFLR